MVLTLHSHSEQFCNHASGGPLSAVVNRAKDLNFRILGMSEHLPRDHERQLYPEEVERHYSPSMLHELFNAYLLESRKLQTSCNNAQSAGEKLHIVVGAETEYIEDSSLRICELYRPQVDYLVGSVHHVNEIPIDFDLATYQKALLSVNGSLDELYGAYYDAQCKMIDKMRPEVIGHFDLIQIFNRDISFTMSESTRLKWQRNVDLIASYGALVEINSRAFKKGLNSPYPSPEIIRYMKDKGIRFTISDDSHGPQDVALYYRSLSKYLIKMDISDIYYLVCKNETARKPAPFSHVNVESLRLDDFLHWISSTPDLA